MAGVSVPWSGGSLVSLPHAAPNQALEPTANSVRCAPAVGGGSPRAFGVKSAEKKQKNMQKVMCTLFLFSQ
jgi:hypothetical protein